MRRHVLVERDILDLATWMARDSRDAAYRFLDAVEHTITDLRHMPGKGSPKKLRLRREHDLRTWSVRGFPNHLVVYELSLNNVYVLAVVHGSQRYRRIVRERMKQ